MESAPSQETRPTLSSCREVSLETNPARITPFAIPSLHDEYHHAAEENWFWFPRSLSRRSSTRLSIRSRSQASTHFCDLDDEEEDDDQEEEEEEEEEEAEEIKMEADVQDLEKQHEQEKPIHLQPNPKTETLAQSSSKKQKRESRLWIMLLDQGLFTVYKRLFLLFLAVNVTALALAATGHFPYARRKAAVFSMANILALTLCRSEAPLRLVFWIAVKALGRPWVPLLIKNGTASILQSLGGVHSGCGLSSIAWLVYALILTLQHRDTTSGEIVAVASAILSLLLLSSMAAFPLVRHLHHNVFERTHRFAGWAALALLWIFIILTFSYDSVSKSYDFHDSRLVKRVEFWLSSAITVLIILPWVTVRRVPVTVTAPSSHASLIKFNGGVKAGLLGRFSRSPLSEWHAFGIISDGEKEHVMLAGAVGDFTRALVSDPPTHVWVRTVHFTGLPYLANMYRRVLFVATGSGICVFLSFLLQACKPDVCFVWVAKGIEQNFGKEIQEMVSGFPKEKVMVHDTAILGRPNVAEMSVDAAKRWGAEVVFITSNPQGSRDIANACKGAGIPAFAPVWDS